LSISGTAMAVQLKESMRKQMKALIKKINAYNEAAGKTKTSTSMIDTTTSN
jgi:hypothetical protein